jgi:hypothetical protein
MRDAGRGKEKQIPFGNDSKKSKDMGTRILVNLARKPEIVRQAYTYEYDECSPFLSICATGCEPACESQTLLL